MPSELKDIIQSTFNSGRFIRLGRRLIFSRSDHSVKEATMSHQQIGAEAGVVSDAAHDAGLYTFTAKTKPPRLSLFSIGGNTNYSPEGRRNSVETAHDTSGGTIEVVGYDDRGKTDDASVVHRRS